MKSKIPGLSYLQYAFREIILGTLIYSLVLGLFSDYTDFLKTGTQSTVFAAAFVLQLLTFLTFILKDKVKEFIEKRNYRFNKLAVGFGIWLVLFFQNSFFFGLLISFLDHQLILVVL